MNKHRFPPNPNNNAPNSKVIDAAVRAAQERATRAEQLKAIQEASLRGQLIPIQTNPGEMLYVQLCRDYARGDAVDKFWTGAMSIHSSGSLIFHGGVFLRGRATVEGFQIPGRITYRLSSVPMAQRESEEVVDAEPWMALEIERDGAAFAAWLKSKNHPLGSVSQDKIAEWIEERDAPAAGQSSETSASGIIIPGPGSS